MLGVVYRLLRASWGFLARRLRPCASRSGQEAHRLARARQRSVIDQAAGWQRGQGVEIPQSPGSPHAKHDRVSAPRARACSAAAA